MKQFKGMVSGWFIAGMLALMVALGSVGTYFTYYNQGVRYEQTIKMVHQDNKVILNSYTTKVQEVAQVPAIYKADLQDVIKGTFEGRYGEDGSQAVFQMIQEQNLNLDPTLYRQIQQVMESGRNDFKTSQQKLVDVTNNYEVAQGLAWSGFWLRLAGYPKINMNDYKILTTDSVEQKFASGKDEVIKLN